MPPTLRQKPMEVARLADEPIRFALHHERHLYVVQDRHITVVDPNFNVRNHTPDFTPTTWSTFGASTCLYDPEQGLMQFSGSSLSLLDSGQGAYSAPYAIPTLNGSAISGGTTFPEHFGEQNGALYTEAGPLRRFETFNAVVQGVPTGVYSAPHQNLLLTQDRRAFGFYNGLWGRLLYGTPPEITVPHVLKNGTLIAGTPTGYAFSPDFGASWRLRNLDGWGVLTDHGMFRVTNNAITLLRGVL